MHTAMSLDSDEAFWPGTNGDHQQLYRGYKRLIYAISERLRRQEVLSLVYQYDLPTWYIEVGPTYEQGHALRVLAQMESMQIFSPTNLRELGQALEALGRADLAKTVGEFEEQNARNLQSLNKSALLDEFQRTDVSRRSFEAHRNKRAWEFQSSRGRSSVDLLHSSSAPQAQQQHKRHQLSLGSSNSREGTPFESVVDFELPTYTAEVAPRETPSNPAMLGVSMTQITAESLTQQINQLRHNLASCSVASNQDVSHPLVQAFLAAKQVCSYLNIAYTTLQSEKIKSTAAHNPTMHVKTGSTGDCDPVRFTSSPVNFQSVSPLHSKSRSVDYLDCQSFNSFPTNMSGYNTLPQMPFPSANIAPSTSNNYSRMRSPSPHMLFTSTSQPRTPSPPPLPPRPRKNAFSTHNGYHHIQHYTSHHDQLGMRRSLSTDNCAVFKPELEEQWPTTEFNTSGDELDVDTHTDSASTHNRTHTTISLPSYNMKRTQSGTLGNATLGNATLGNTTARLTASVVDLHKVSSGEYFPLVTKKSPKEWFKRKSKEERLPLRRK